MHLWMMELGLHHSRSGRDECTLYFFSFVVHLVMNLGYTCDALVDFDGLVMDLWIYLDGLEHLLLAFAGLTSQFQPAPPPHNNQPVSAATVFLSHNHQSVSVKFQTSERGHYYICDIYCDGCDMCGWMCGWMRSICDGWDIYVIYVCMNLFVMMECKKIKNCRFGSLCRVLHSSKDLVAECHDHGTRQRIFF